MTVSTHIIITSKQTGLLLEPFAFCPACGAVTITGATSC